jgi:hypothetical protein
MFTLPNAPNPKATVKGPIPLFRHTQMIQNMLEQKMTQD